MSNIFEPNISKVRREYAREGDEHMFNASEIVTLTAELYDSVANKKGYYLPRIITTFSEPVNEGVYVGNVFLFLNGVLQIGNVRNSSKDAPLMRITALDTESMLRLEKQVGIVRNIS